ncbi:MAG: Gfo/Idh/MocA family oxidoreductase [Planctomycetota bacterium]
MTVRVGIFGNGFARNVVLPCLRHVTGVEVVGIASPTIERVQETATEFGIPIAVSDHRELLQRTNFDLALIMTPPHRHLDQSRDALKAGCHVICEKPTAMNAAESLEMQQLGAAHADQISLIDHELRMDPRRIQLREWVKADHLGTVQHVTYTLRSPSLRGPREFGWWFDAECGGGALGALGSHAVDSMRAVCGEVTSVRGHLETLTKERRDAGGMLREVTVDELANAWLRFESGALATMHISMVEGERQHTFAVAGSDGVASVEEQGPLRVGFGDDALAPYETTDELPANAELQIPDTDWARNFIRLARATVAAIENGSTQVAGAATFVDGHRTQLVLDAIRSSHASGNWVNNL